jgi:hypothetical protein
MDAISMSGLYPNSVSVTPGGFAAFEPFGLWPATRAAASKNESSRFAFLLAAKAANRIPKTIIHS